VELPNAHQLCLFSVIYSKANPLRCCQDEECLEVLEKLLETGLLVRVKKHFWSRERLEITPKGWQTIFDLNARELEAMLHQYKGGRLVRFCLKRRPIKTLPELLVCEHRGLRRLVKQRVAEIDG